MPEPPELPEPPEAPGALSDHEALPEPDERSGVRRARRTAPWWAWSLLHALVLGTAVWAVLVLRQGPEVALTVTSSPTSPELSGTPPGAGEHALRTGAATGLVFGAITGPLTARHQRHAAAHAEHLPRHRRRAVRRGVRRGPPPADPELRGAAALLAEHRWRVALRQRPFVLAVAVVFGGLYARLAVDSSAWWWAGVAAVTVLAAAQVWWPRRLRRRAELLAGEALPRHPPEDDELRDEAPGDEADRGGANGDGADREEGPREGG